MGDRKRTINTTISLLHSNERIIDDPNDRSKSADRLLEFSISVATKK